MYEETDPIVGVVYGRHIDWQMDAACNGTDVETFFPNKGESTSDAKRICRRCPVRAECLEYALDMAEKFGVWGNCSERERRRLQRQLADGADAA